MADQHGILDTHWHSKERGRERVHELGMRVPSPQENEGINAVSLFSPECLILGIKSFLPLIWLKIWCLCPSNLRGGKGAGIRNDFVFPNISVYLAVLNLAAHQHQPKSYGNPGAFTIPQKNYALIKVVLHRQYEHLCVPVKWVSSRGRNLLTSPIPKVF